MNQPNIIFITSHDSGRHFGCYGVKSVNTPHIDALAAEGCRFDGMHSVASICSPSRACMMTGRYPQRNGVMGLAHDPFAWRFKPGEQHLSHLLRDAGYQTALIGHFHETMDAAGDLAFDHQSGYELPEDERTDFIPYAPADRVAGCVESFLSNERDQDRPLYLQIGFFETHTPFNFGGVSPDRERGVAVPEPAVDNDSSQKYFADFQGALKSLDAAVGKILASLDTHGLRENTILVFTTDHGIDLMPYRRFKHSLYERGIEVAFLMRFPGKIAPHTQVPGLLSNVDVTPTLLELAGREAPDNLDGKSFVRAFEDPSFAREAAFAEYVPADNGQQLRSVTTARHKLIRSFEAHRMQRAPVDMGKPPGGPNAPVFQLFDLQADPHELRNLADDPAYREIRDALDQKVADWMRTTGDPLVTGGYLSPYTARALEQLP